MAVYVQETAPMVMTDQSGGTPVLAPVVHTQHASVHHRIAPEREREGGGGNQTMSMR